jgi:sarcosine oxidase subunit gamma
MAMFSLQHTSPLRARFGEPAAAIRRAGLEIAEAVVAAQFQLSGDLGAADIVYAVGRATGCSLSDQPNRKSGGDPYAVWLAPDKRLLVCESGDRHALHRDLAVAFSDRFAAASDVTDGLAMLDLRGERLPDLLAWACALDLDPRRFAADQSARTLFADLPVLLYRRGGGVRLHVDRGVAGHLWTWLDQAAAAIAP